MRARLSNILALLFVSVTMASGHAVADEEGSLTWLEARVKASTAVDLQMDKAQFAFRGFRQTQYALSLVRELASDWQFEAIAHYRRGALDYGALSQKVRTQAYELIAWHTFERVRMGVSHAAQPHHQIALSDQHVNLPTSETLAVHVDVPISRSTEQVVRISFLRETWSADNMSLPVDWQRRRDSQVQLAYSMAF